MTLFHVILDLAALILWLNWYLLPFEAGTGSFRVQITPAAPASRRPYTRWVVLASLTVLLLVRTLFYWHIGSALDWAPRINLGALILTFRSDFLDRMMFFSLASFGLLLFKFYTWVLLLSAATPPSATPGAAQRSINLLLGRFARWPAWFKLLAPVLAGAVAWCAFHPVLSWMTLTPPSPSFLWLLAQSGVIGLCALLAWKPLILALLGLHLLHSYVYMGLPEFWNYVSAVARRILRPLDRLPLKFRKVDFTPVAGIVLVVLFFRLLEWLWQLGLQKPQGAWWLRLSSGG